jgi:hypothetical protein
MMPGLVSNEAIRGQQNDARNTSLLVRAVQPYTSDQYKVPATKLRIPISRYLSFQPGSPQAERIYGRRVLIAATNVRVAVTVATVAILTMKLGECLMDRIVLRSMPSRLNGLWSQSNSRSSNCD